MARATTARTFSDSPGCSPTRQVDVVFARTTEAQLLVAGGTPAELTNQLAAGGARQVVMTLDAAGSYARIDDVVR